jgi:hypothetical protein
VPVSFSFRIGALGGVLCAAVGLGYSYRVVITPQGISIRTSLGAAAPPP